MLVFALMLAAQIAPQSADLPNRQPQLAYDGTRLGLAYGAGNSVFFAASTDSGKTWTKPVLVSTPGKLSLGMRRGPRIAMSPEAIVISAVAGPSGGGADGDLLAWRSVDGGKSWSAGKVINDVASAAREGLHAMVAGGNGVVFAVWLDLRQKGTRLYGSTSHDGGATWSPSVLVYESPSGTVCQCCHPSAAIDAQGRIFRSEEHTSELQSLRHLVCRLLLEKTITKSAKNQACPQRAIPYGTTPPTDPQ